MRLRDYRHIIWDWNGTLLNDAWLCVEVMNGMLAERGLPMLTAARYQQVFDFPVKEYYRRLGYDFSRESFEVLGTLFMEGYERRRTECQLQEGARELIAQLHAEGITQSILSAYRHDSLEGAVRHYGLEPYFEQVLGIDDHYADGKTAQGLRLIGSLGLERGTIVFVGDTTHDYEVACAMGVDCTLIEAGNHAREKLAACGVPVFGSLRELLENFTA
jgi:phosphoglycolate phosphatase